MSRNTLINPAMIKMKNEQIRMNESSNCMVRACHRGGG
jgi:hypothetical protein